MAFAARIGRVDKERVRLSRVEQCLAVEFEVADLRVNEVLDLMGSDADFVATPHLTEFLT